MKEQQDEKLPLLFLFNKKYNKNKYLQSYIDIFPITYKFTCLSLFESKSFLYLFTFLNFYS